MIDWKVRAQAESWSLVNLATAYFCSRFDHKAAEVCEFTLDKKKCPASIEGNLKTMLGSYWLAYGDLEKAFTLLSTIDADRLVGFYQVVFYQAMSALEGKRNGESYSEIKQSLETLLVGLGEEFSTDMPTLERNHNLILWSIARREGKSIRAALLKRKSQAEALV